jgi:DNA-binding NarL/FixJ family response regulator
MKKHTNILIADDHQLFLDGLQLIFTNHPVYNIIAQAHEGNDVLEAFKQHSIDLAILDINMPKPNGFEICKIIRKEYPLCKIVVLSMYHEDQFVDEFMKSGASAYVLKNAGKVELLNALDVAMKGGTYISKELQHNSTSESKDDFTKSHTLTKREIEIIKLLAKEKSSNDIAQLLFLSTFTVNTHRKNILQKLGLKNSAGLIKFASDNSLI